MLWYNHIQKFLKYLLGHVNKQPGKISLQFSSVRFLFMNRCVTSSRLFLMKGRAQQSEKLVTRINMFIKIMINVSGVMKLHTSVNYVVDIFKVIALECVEIMHVL